jgi:hypothetical protein
MGYFQPESFQQYTKRFEGPDPFQTLVNRFGQNVAMEMVRVFGNQAFNLDNRAYQSIERAARIGGEESQLREVQNLGTMYEKGWTHEAIDQRTALGTMGAMVAGGDLTDVGEIGLGITQGLMGDWESGLEHIGWGAGGLAVPFVAGGMMRKGGDILEALRGSRARRVADNLWDTVGPPDEARAWGRAPTVKEGAEDDVKAIYRIRQDLVDTDAGVSFPQIHEVEGVAGANRFHEAITRAKETNPQGASVYAYEPGEYAGMRLFLTEDGTAGFAIKDGDELVSVFKAADSPHQSFATSAVRLAVEEGARRADAFDTVLPEIYAQNGFEVVSRMKFNPEFQPEGWRAEDFAEWNQGQPDVVGLRYNPEGTRSYEPGQGKLTDDYEEFVEETKKPLAPEGRTDVSHAGRLERMEERGWDTSLPLFHATQRAGEFEDFSPFSHFGTQRSAAQRSFDKMDDTLDPAKTAVSGLSGGALPETTGGIYSGFMRKGEILDIGDDIGYHDPLGVMAQVDAADPERFGGMLEDFMRGNVFPKLSDEGLHGVVTRWENRLDYDTIADSGIDLDAAWDRMDQVYTPEARQVIEDSIINAALANPKEGSTVASLAALNTGVRDELHQMASDDLMSELDFHGIRGLSYKNTEEDVGSISYIIPNPKENLISSEASVITDPDRSMGQVMGRAQAEPRSGITHSTASLQDQNVLMSRPATGIYAPPTSPGSIYAPRHISRSEAVLPAAYSASADALRGGYRGRHFPLLRAAPATERGTPPARIAGLFEDDLFVRDVDRLAELGGGAGGFNWWETGNLRNLWRADLGDELGDARTNLFLALGTGMSARSAVKQELKRASYVMQQGIEGGRPVADILSNVPEGYGHLASATHAKKIAWMDDPVLRDAVERGWNPYDPVTDPKMASYLENKYGNLWPVTLDAHGGFGVHGLLNFTKDKDTGLMLMNKAGPTPAEYPFLEEAWQRNAQRFGVPPAGYQSAWWTGQGIESGTVRDVLSLEGQIERLAWEKARATGTTARNVLLGVGRGTHYFSAGGIGLGAGAMNRWMNQDEGQRQASYLNF